MPKPNFEIPHVFEVTLPSANMLSHEKGQLNFSHEGQSYSFLMSRDDFRRLGRRIIDLLRASDDG